MEKSIAESFIFVDYSQQLWRELFERFGQTNVPQLYALHRRLMTIEQNDDSVAEYFGKLKRVWDELHLLEGFPDCNCGALQRCSCGLLKKILEADQRMKLIQFLSGLNKSYDQVRVNILSSDPLPTINRAYHILQQVERQSANQTHMAVEFSALHASNVAHKSSSHKKDFKRFKNDKTCDHCKMKGHSID